jgi:integrase
MPRRITPLKVSRRLPEGYSIDDIVKVLAHAEKKKGYVKAAPARLWWWTILSAYFDTGARCSVLFERTWADIDWKRSTLRLPGDEQKHRVEQRKDLHPQTLERLATMREHVEPRPTAKIWKAPFTVWWFRKLVKRLATEAGVSRLPRLPLHGFRIAHGSYLFDKLGLDAARESLRHSSGKTTMKHYIDPTLLSGKKTASQLPPRVPAPDRDPTAEE